MKYVQLKMRTYPLRYAATCWTYRGALYEKCQIDWWQAGVRVDTFSARDIYWRRIETRCVVAGRIPRHAHLLAGRSQTPAGMTSPRADGRRNENIHEWSGRDGHQA